MADYKYRAATPQRNRRTERRGNRGLWFFGGFISGAFLMGLVWLKLGPELAAGRVPGMPPAAAPTPPASAQKPPKPHFEFYTILPEMEVVIPDEEILPPRKSDPVPPEVQEETVQPTETQHAYILQMGSFRNSADAERMKASLALIGIEAEIQKVSINNRDTYHRVRSGPYRSQRELNRVRQRAKDNNINPLVIRLKG
jgi:cell division protein FtsN